MKTLTVNQKRWDRLIDAFIYLGKGKIDRQLPIQNLEDDFESLEVLFNLVNEELRDRLLHLSFVKPNEFQKYTNQYVFIVTNDFKIKHICNSFLEDNSLVLENLQDIFFLDLIDTETSLYLKEYLENKLSFTEITKQSLILFEQSYLYRIQPLNSTKMLVINLYQMYLDPKSFQPFSTDGSKKSRLKERKRNEFIIEEIKIYLDHYPLHKRMSLGQLCKQFGINSSCLKKLFKEQYQTTIYNYYISLRMKHAYILIETGTLTFKEISIMVGYPRYPAFVLYFKKYYKMLPKEVRFKSQNLTAKTMP